MNVIIIKKNRKLINSDSFFLVLEVFIDSLNEKILFFFDAGWGNLTEMFY
jgi:hypothetical protein